LGAYAVRDLHEAGIKLHGTGASPHAVGPMLHSTPPLLTALQHLQPGTVQPIILHPLGLPHHTPGLTGHHVLAVNSFTREQVRLLHHFVKLLM
jgi:hypothetical protein